MGSQKKSEWFSELIVGVFMVAVLALLAYFTIVISGVDILNGRKKVRREAEFADVGGLKLRDNVVMRGIPVGSVDGLRIEQGKVRVELLLQGDVRLHEGYSLTVCAGSLLGGNYLLIEDGSGGELPENELLHGNTSGNWMRDLGEIVAQVKEAVRAEELHSIVTNIQSAANSIKVVSARLENGEGLLGKLLSPDDSLYLDLSNSVANIRSITAKLNEGTNSVARFFNDDGLLYDDLRGTVANVRSISDRLEKGEGTLGKLLSSDETIYDDLKETMARVRSSAVKLDEGNGTLGKLLSDEGKVYGDLAATAENLKTVTDRLQKGEGTLGKLSADETLYTDVKGLVQDVRQTVDNYRDTTPITAFASLLMGAL